MSQVIQHQEKLRDLTAMAIDYAKSLGADAVEVAGAYAEGFTIQAHQGEVDTVEYDKTRSFAITVMIGRKRGSASTNEASESAIQSAVQAAYQFARYAEEDPFLSLPEPSELAFDVSAKETYYPWDISVKEAIEWAINCEVMARTLDKRIKNTDGASVSSHQDCFVLANSLGFMNGYCSSSHQISCSPIASMGEQMERDDDYTVAVNPEDLWTIETVAGSAVKKALARLGSRSIASAKVPVLFVDSAATSLIRQFISAISGGRIYRKSSFLVDHLGKPVFTPSMNIVEAPYLVKGMGNSPFDDEGVGMREKFFIRDGVLENYLLSTYSANQLNMKTTGNAGGVSNLLVTHTMTKPLNDLIRHMNKGVIITETMGDGLNLVTGDFSRGFCGFWVEHGEIQFPLHEMTVAGNLRDVFQRMVGMSDDVDLRSSVRTGALLVEALTIAGG